MKISAIYKLTSPSNKVYIGQSVDVANRLSKHKCMSHNHKTKLGAAIRKYGWENFKIEYLFKTEDRTNIKDILNQLEKDFINLYNCVTNGYNLMTGGDSSLHSKESIEKISTYSKNKSPEHIEKLRQTSLNRYKEQPMKDSTKQKIREANKSRMRKVYKYDSEDNFIKEYECINDAARDLHESKGTIKTKSNRIGECCHNKRKSFFKYKFSFVKLS